VEDILQRTLRVAVTLPEDRFDASCSGTWQKLKGLGLLSAKEESLLSQWEWVATKVTVGYQSRKVSKDGWGGKSGEKGQT